MPLRHYFTPLLKISNLFPVKTRFNIYRRERSIITSEASAHASGCTEDDYYNLPKNVRSELIDGQFYSMSAPSRIHQKILMELSWPIQNYIRSKTGKAISAAIVDFAALHLFNSLYIPAQPLIFRLKFPGFFRCFKAFFLLSGPRKGNGLQIVGQASPG